MSAVPWVRRLVTGLSPRSPRYDGMPFYVGFLVDTVALGQVCLQVFWFSPVRIIPPVLHNHLSVTETV